MKAILVKSCKTCPCKPIDNSPCGLKGQICLPYPHKPLGKIKVIVKKGIATCSNPAVIIIDKDINK